MAQATSRLFFALWPDEKIQRRLADLAHELARDSNGNPIPWRNIHATLAFLGNAADDAVSELTKLADDQRDFSCELVLDRIESFPHGVVYAAAKELPEELLELAADLHRALRERGYRIKRRPFVPHVTLMRNAQGSPESSAISPITWPVRGIRLVHSELHPSGAVYHLLGYEVCCKT